MPDNQATQRLAEVLNRIARLPSANLEPPQFFANFLQMTVAATGSRGGAIWVIQPGQGPQCYCHVEMDICRIKEPDQQRLIVEALQRCAKEEKPLVLPAAGMEATQADGQEASGNLCNYPLFFKPLKAGQQVAMVVQMIAGDNLTPHDFRAVVGLLDQIGESAEKYLAHRRAAVLDDDRKALARLLKYAEVVHDSLDAQKVVYQIANLGRDAIGCERVVVWIDPKVKRGLRAVSGIDKPDRRAVLLQSLEKLSKHCLQIKKPVVASRKQLMELPEEEELTILLKDYFNISKLDQIFLHPIKHEEEYLGVVIAEGFDEQTGVNLAGVMAAVCSHGASALNNALEMASVPMVRPLAKLKKVKDDPKKRRKWLIRTVVVLVGLVVLSLVPWKVKIKCACELTPKYTRVVQSGLDGVQIVSIEKSSGTVQKGEVIALLDDLELKTQLGSLQQELEQERINWRQAVSEVERQYSKLQIDILQNKIDFYTKQIEKCRVTAPISGTILTAQLERKERMTLKKGDPICEIADLTQWQLLLDVPQEEIGWVQQGLGDNKQPRVQFFLNAYPKSRLQATMSNVQQISQMPRIKDEGNVYEIRVDVTEEELEDIRNGLRQGLVGRAKIETVHRALGYVLLRKVIRFFRVTFF